MTRKDNINWVKECMKEHACKSDDNIVKIPVFDLVRIIKGNLLVTEETARSYIDVIIASEEFEFDTYNFILRKNLI